MVYLIVNWVLSSLSLFVLAMVVPGFRVQDLESALVAAGVVGLISAALGGVLRIATGVLSLSMSAAFLVIVDAFLFRVSGLVVPGFAMQGFLPAFLGALVLLALNLALWRVARIRSAGLDQLLSS